MVEGYTLVMGLNCKDTKKPMFDTEVAVSKAEKVLAEHVSGWSILQNRGGYTHENGEMVIEKGLRIELLWTSKEIVKSIIKKLKVTFNQESIMLQEHKPNVEFV